MICLAIGLGVLGFAAMRRARRCHGGGHSWHGRGGWHRHHRGGRRSWMMHAALERIDERPGGGARVGFAVLIAPLPAA